LRSIPFKVLEYEENFPSLFYQCFLVQPTGPMYFVFCRL
jgi:hypothetical protein